MDLRELLNYIEFSYHIETNSEGVRVIKLDDNRHANLGGIEDEEFTSIAQVIDRCDIYWRDYCVTPLCEDMGVSENQFKNWEHIYKYAKIVYGDEVDKNTILGYLINPSSVTLNEEL